MKNKKIITMFVFFLISVFAYSDARDDFIRCAKTHLGTKYKYAGATSAGLDCSGFVYLSAKEAKIKDLPHSASQIYSVSTKIQKSELKKGDLVFFKDGNSVSHVGIYLENNQMIHSASSGPKTGVIISSLSEKYWANHYFACGRIITDSQTTTAKNEQNKTSTSNTNTTSKTSSNSSTSSNKTSTKKRKNNSSIAFDFTGYLDWTFLNLPENEIKDGEYPFVNDFRIRGFALETQLRTTFWSINPGIMAKAMVDKKANNVELPVCFVLNMGDYFAVYTGVVFGFGSDDKKTTIQHTSTKIEPGLYPGIFGIKLQTPALTFGKYGFSLVQDISYTHFNPIDENIKMSTKERIVSGLSFQTGLRFTIK